MFNKREAYIITVYVSYFKMNVTLLENLSVIFIIILYFSRINGGNVIIKSIIII
jgi:hypothetical protein